MKKKTSKPEAADREIKAPVPKSNDKREKKPSIYDDFEDELDPDIEEFQRELEDMRFDESWSEEEEDEQSDEGWDRFDEEEER